LKKFGATDLLGSANTDIEDASKLQDTFLEAGTIPTIRPGVDNSAVILAQHIEFAKTDEFLELPPEQQQAFLEYCKMRMYDVAQRRVWLTAAGMDPDVPALTEIPQALAQAGLVAGTQAQQQIAAATQSGGQPSGATSPDPRLDNEGKPKAGSGLPGAPPSPDIAETLPIGGPMPPSVHPEGSPRAINLPPNA
jgi:hypothetical protein